MKAWHCMACHLGWTEWGKKWERRCPFCRSSKIIPSEEAR